MYNLLVATLFAVSMCSFSVLIAALLLVTSFKIRSYFALGVSIILVMCLIVFCVVSQERLKTYLIKDNKIEYCLIDEKKTLVLVDSSLVYTAKWLGVYNPYSSLMDQYLIEDSTNN